MDKEAVPVLVVYPHPESSSNAVTVKFTVRTECFCFFFSGGGLMSQLRVLQYAVCADFLIYFVYLHSSHNSVTDRIKY